MPASVCKDLLRLTNVSPSMSNVCFLIKTSYLKSIINFYLLLKNQPARN